jgi:tetratricopeptide (TPR) repeat protein
MLGARAGRPEFVEYLCRETEGNPFFLVEVVRALAEQVGQLDQVSRGELPEGLLTGGIERIVQHRVGRVPSDFHPLLEVAAAIGRRLDLRLLSRLAGDVDLESWLLTCANAAVLESRADEWRFAHDKLREALLSRLSAERRAPLYRAVVAVAEETYDAAERAHKSAALAHYAEQAEDGDRAALYHLQAADLATHRCAYLVARKHYAAAIEWLARLPANEQRSRLFIDARLKQVYVTMVSDSPETNLARMAEVKDRLAALANGGEPTQADRLRLARANYFMGRVHFYRGDPRQAVLCYREVLPVARESGDDELLALPSCLIAIALAIQGKMLEAEPLLSLSIEPLERLGEPFEWFRAVGYRGFTLVALGRCAEGDHELLRVHERARKIEQPSLSSAAHLMRGSASILLKGDLAAGLADMQQVLYFAKQTGDGLHASLAHNNSAWALAQLGRHEEARASRRKGLEAAAEMGGRLMLADWHEAADAEMELLAGRYEQALALADAVRRSSREQDLVASLGIAERVYAEALAALNRFAEAEPHFEASLEAFARGGIALQVARTHLRRAVWRKRVGLRASADVALGLALEVFERSGLSAAAEQAAGTYRDA